MRHPYKTARCILFRQQPTTASEYLLAIHSSFWGKKDKRWGLPGGRIERGESPEFAVKRELEEELSIFVPELIEIGPYPYKRSLHMVYAAQIDDPVAKWDESELLDVRWFDQAGVTTLHTDDALHASYELDAIRALLQKLGD